MNKTCIEYSIWYVVLYGYFLCVIYIMSLQCKFKWELPSRALTSGVFRGAIGPWPPLAKKLFFTIGKNRKTWFGPPFMVACVAPFMKSMASTCKFFDLLDKATC